MDDKKLRLVKWCSKRNNSIFIILCLFAHILLEIIFWGLKLYLPLAVNTASAIFYIVVAAVLKDFSEKAVKITCYEVMLFSMCQTAILGFDAYFWLYSLGIAAIIFLILGDISAEGLKFQLCTIMSLAVAAFLKYIISYEVFEGQPSKVEIINDAFKNLNIITVLIFVYILSCIYTVEIIYTKQQLEDKNKELLYSAEHDLLTGLLNRYNIMNVLKEANKKKMKEEIIVCMMDIDYFKHVNDTYGHSVGDEVLVDISAKMQKMLPEFYNIRWGGEEFLMVSKENINAESAGKISDFRAEVKKMKFENYPEPITITIGMVKGCIKDIEELIIKADKLLYKGKQEGRDRIVSEI